MNKKKIVPRSTKLYFQIYNKFVNTLLRDRPFLVLRVQIKPTFVESKILYIFSRNNKNVYVTLTYSWLYSPNCFEIESVLWELLCCGVTSNLVRVSPYKTQCFNGHRWHNLTKMWEASLAKHLSTLAHACARNHIIIEINRLSNEILK